MSNLKPCPICGDEPELQHFNVVPNVRGRIICSCGLEIRQGANDTEDDLRIIWNTRANEGTRWHELFGTPEMAARTLIAVHGECETSKSCYPDCPFGDAPTCPRDCWSDDYDRLLEWLRGDA